MVKGLKEEIEKFSQEIKESNPDYTSIYTYFMDYINEKAYKDDIELRDFLINEFSRRDIIKACAYYYENSNAFSITAIEKFLNSITKFYSSYMKPNGYDNTNLFLIYPFAKLKNDVIDFIDKDILEKQVNPPISDYDFEHICNYFNLVQKPSITQRQISIIFKLIMLYGFKLERIRSLKKSNFDFGTRLLIIVIENGKNITLELPISLTLEIESYLNSPKCNKSDYMFLNTKNTEIDPSFLSYQFGKIRECINDDSEINKFTSTGLAKYGIIKMLKAGMNVPVIKMITGMEDDVINDCTRFVYGLDKPSYLNRYINSTVRAVKTYDELGLPVYANE